MSARYALVVQRLRWLTDAIEEWLNSCVGEGELRLSELRGIVSGRRATNDELAAVLEALVDVGAIGRSSAGYRVNREGLISSAGYRSGVRDALMCVEPQFARERVRLVAALPASVAGATRSVVEREASDLRLAVVDLIACAQNRVVLASPFWDHETVTDLQGLLARRIAAGVRVDLLGRTLGGDRSGEALAALASHLGSRSCRAVAWHRPDDSDRFGSETFHFKVAVADNKYAYLGTANFTASGLRSRMELGVVGYGDFAEALARILDAVLEL